LAVIEENIKAKYLFLAKLKAEMLCISPALYFLYQTLPVITHATLPNLKVNGKIEFQKKN
jgi:hypothetical protein